MWDLIGEEFEDDHDDWELIGETICAISIDGDGVFLETDGGYKLHYDASDGGYSCWSIEKH